MDNNEDFDTLVSQINGVYDTSNDPTQDAEKIIDHSFVSGKLELHIKYLTKRVRNDKEWHSINLVNNEDQHALDHCVLKKNWKI